MRVGIDIDGVIANFYDAYEVTLWRVTGRNDFPQRGKDGVSIYPPVWDWPQHYGYTHAEVGEAWKLIKNDPSFWRRLPPLPDIWYVRELVRQKDLDIYFVTARPGVRAKEQTEVWLERQLGINATVLLSDRKGDIARGLDLHAYVDDKASNCVDVTEKSPTTRVYIPDRDYNRNEPIGGAIRIANLGEMLEIEGLREEAA